MCRRCWTGGGAPAGRQLRNAFPGRKDLHIVHETIYQALYIQGRRGLSRELVKWLRTGRFRRKPKRAIARRSSRFAGDMLMITDRAVEASNRVVPGHGEGDLIMGTRYRSAIATLVERNTRYLMLVHLPDGTVRRSCATDSSRPRLRCRPPCGKRRPGIGAARWPSMPNPPQPPESGLLL
jgi:IS30 family transposase